MNEDPIRVLANRIFDEHCGYIIFSEDADDNIAEIAFELENLVDSVKREQREICAEKIKSWALKQSGLCMMDASQAGLVCLNAVEKDDE